MSLGNSPCSQPPSLDEWLERLRVEAMPIFFLLDGKQTCLIEKMTLTHGEPAREHKFQVDRGDNLFFSYP